MRQSGEPLRSARTAARADPLGEPPAGGFEGALATASGGEALTLPARRVARAVVPPECGLVRAGADLFAWVHRHGLAVAGPTLEERLVDGDGVATTVLEIPVGDESRLTPVQPGWGMARSRPM